MTEDEMVGWHHRLNGHEFEQARVDGEGQGSLAFCSPWDRRESRCSANGTSFNLLQPGGRVLGAPLSYSRSVTQLCPESPRRAGSLGSVP